LQAAVDGQEQEMRIVVVVCGDAAVFFESLVVRLLVGMGYGGSITDVSRALTEGSGDTARHSQRQTPRPVAGGKEFL
jgi:restriction endonuclease Mrr